MSGAVLATCNVGGEEKILLGKRLKDPNRGKWVLPGGGMRVGEDGKLAAEREVLEEAGVEIENVENFIITDHQEETLGKKIVWVTAEIKNPSDIRGGDDLGEPTLFSRDELLRLDGISDIVRPVLEEAGWLEGPGFT